MAARVGLGGLPNRRIHHLLPFILSSTYHRPLLAL